MKLIVTIIMCVFLLMAVPAWSACKEASIPGLPNPDLTDEVEMLRVQSVVRHYLKVQEEFLSCVHDDRRHNRALNRMQELAEKYNRITRRYKARMQSLDMFTELVLLDI